MLNWKYKIVILFLILIIGISLRICKLGSNDFWYDEVLSIEYSKHLDRLESDRNPPLYYILLNIWRHFFKENEFFLRLPSVIFSILTILLIYKLGKHFFGYWVGLVGSFIFSISPIHIWYSQEARGYTLSVFLIMITIYFFILALKENRNYLWAGFVVSSVLTMYTNYFAFLIIFAEVIIISLKKYRWLIKKWLISYLFIMILFSPWGLSFLGDVVAVKEHFWIPKPSLKSILITFENFNVGYNATQIVHSISIFLYLLLFILGISYAKKEKSIILLSFLFLPIVITFAISQWMPIYIDRQLILYSPFYYLLVAAGVVKIRRPMIRTIFLSSISILSISSLYNYYSDYMPSSYMHHLGTYTKKPVKPVVRYIRENFKKGDITAYSSIPAWYTFLAYWDSEPIDAYYFIIPHTHEPYFGKIIGGWPLEGKPEVIDLSKGIKDLDLERIWLITSSWPRDGTLDDNSYAVTEWMEQHYIGLESKEFDGIFITLYIPKSK